MTCASCTHFTAKAGSDATIEPARDDLSRIGICRRYPPRMTPKQAFTPSLFPNVHRNHVCGEYQSGVPL